jgi:spermidine/putrescine transport system substrate-binding protein
VIKPATTNRAWPLALIATLLLAACGIAPTESQGGGASGGPDGASAEPVGGGEPSGTLEFANWPLYIDVDDEGNSPTRQQFEEEFGIDVTYTESIEDNVSFFGQIQPALAAGESTGYDLIVVTDWMVGNMIRLGYLERIDVERDVPNFLENTGDVYKDRSYDPGNQYSVPYQSGITGIGYNPALVDEEITSWAQLFDPEFIEKYCGQIGMFSDTRDGISAALLYNGIVPTEATEADVEAAQQVLLDQAPCVRGYYGNEYADGLARGDLAITMAWSGDVFQLQFDDPDLQFVVPEEGAILWTDNMVIPKGAEHPNDALAMMDFLYRPEIAAQVAEYVNFITPVPGAQEIIRQHAEEAAADGDEETADYLNAVADSPLVFPTDETLSRVYNYKVLDEEEEQFWNELFQEVTQG